MKKIQIHDKNYPKTLLTLSDPPKQLYTLGDENLLNTFALAIVGTRTPTHYGEEITKALSYGLAKQGITIISGMAKGVDKNAHTGAILAKGKTIAVLRFRLQPYLPKRKHRTIS